MNPMLTHDDLLSFYARQTSFTDPGPSASLYDGLPEDLPGLCQAVQNALLHLFWISEDAAGTSLEKLKNDGRLPCVEFSLGSIAKRLEWLADRNSTPLQVPRKPSERNIACCRDFALMLTSILRHRGIPARVRTGVAGYLLPDSDRMEDHYITQFWNATKQQWQFVDPQIDTYQREALRITFDTTDIEPERFLTGNRLMESLQDGSTVPNRVGFPPVNTGLTYGRSKLFQDLLNLVGQEIRVYAWWGIGDPHRALVQEDETLIDRMLHLTRGIEADRPQALQEALALAATEVRLVRPTAYDPGTWSAPGVC